MQLWIKNLSALSKKLQYPDITNVIYTDASVHGLGVYCERMSTGRSWINTELAYKGSRIKIHSFKSRVSCQGSWDSCKDFFR